MPTLNWIGKEAVVKHHKDVPYRLLEPVPELSCGDTSSGNLIVQGDNLHALKALLPRYAGKEGETLDRHDRWLCMMYPRLVLLRQFLSEEGAIFISIDDNEIASLRLLMDEVFGGSNFVATVLWQKVFSPKNSARHLSEDHDYVVVYASNSATWKPHLLPRTEEAVARYKNPDNDSRGPWTSGDLQARNYYSEGTYPVTCPSGRVIPGPGRGMYWRVSLENFRRLDAEKRIWWGDSGDNMPRLKRYLSDVKEGVVPQTMWFYKDVGHTQEAKKELLQLVDFDSSEDVFITPKPSRLIQRILEIATDKDSVVLDSFAGSGTTGHAVLKQNSIDGGTRRFILVEIDEHIASGVTRRRLERLTTGYAPANEAPVAGLGSGFQFCTLSAQPVFDAHGQIRRDVSFSQLAEFVWFAETGTGYTGDGKSPLLGTHEGRAVYLLYNGILKDRSIGGGNVLTGPVFDSLPRFDGPKVIYAAGNRIGARAVREAVTFKQTPYAIEV